MTTEHLEAYSGILSQFESEGRLRRIPPHRDPVRYYDLASNDYMALAFHADEFKARFLKEKSWLPFSASASRMLALSQEAFCSLENLLGSLYGRPALLFNSGYHANVGLIGALNVPGTLFLADKMIHASTIDGLSQRKCEFERWRHNDPAHLRRLLEKHRSGYDRFVVLAESVYSMDGDTAPLAELVALKREFGNVILVVDEAHGFGTRGDRGLGLCEEKGLTDDIDIIVGTLGKACASAGAFIVASQLLHDYLLNTSRPLIFSTALPPIVAAWTELMVSRLVEMKAEREHLAAISERFRKRVEEITGRECASRSQIVPLITGDAEKAVAISRQLEKNGVIALPIRRPTVPPGGERIRFSLNADLSADDIDRILTIIRKASK